MVDMFFYRDPEEVEKQQQEEAQAKAAAAAGEAVEPASGDWGVTSAPAGGIDPALVATEGGACHFSMTLHTVSRRVLQLLTGLPSPLVPRVLLTGQQSLPALKAGVRLPLAARPVGNERYSLYSCVVFYLFFSHAMFLAHSLASLSYEVCGPMPNVTS